MFLVSWQRNPKVSPSRLSYDLRLKAADDEIAAHVAALDAIEEALFGDNFRRSRDDLVEEAVRLREENAELRSLWSHARLTRGTE